MFRNISGSSVRGWIGLALLIPAVVVFGVEWSGVEPWHGILKNWTTAGDGMGLNASGKLLIVGSVVMLPIASLAMNLGAVARGRGLELTRVPHVAVALAGGLLVFLICGFVVDQAPCWAGVPNCD